MPNAIPKLMAEKKKVGITIPRELRDRFDKWMTENGFMHNGKPSPFMFFTSVKSGGWRRDGTKKLPKHKMSTSAMNVCVGVPPDAHAFLSKTVVAHFKNWAHFVSDFVSGNWQRVEQKEEV